MLVQLCLSDTSLQHAAVSKSSLTKLHSCTIAAEESYCIIFAAAFDKLGERVRIAPHRSRRTDSRRWESLSVCQLRSRCDALEPQWQ